MPFRGPRASTVQSHPPAVIRLAEGLGVRDNGGATVRLAQVGRMRSSAVAPWRSFKATQTIATDRCAFDWKARTGPIGVVAIRDALVEDVGHLDVRALGFPLARVEPSDALTRGELIRYLAELAWAPDAILCNPDIRWREDAVGELHISAGSRPTEAEVAVTLTAEGRISEVYSPDRGALIDGIVVPTPWRGVFSDYRRHDGRWLPFAGEAAWGQGAEAWTYWQGRLEHWTQS